MGGARIELETDGSDAVKRARYLGGSGVSRARIELETDAVKRARYLGVGLA